MSLPTAIQVASDLLSIHHHNDETNEIYYKEKELLPILAKWGHIPDWQGNAKEHEEFLQSMHMAFLDLHPGKLIAECIDSSKMSFELAAQFLGVSEKTLDKILYKGGTISSVLAKRLEQLFHKPANEWLNMQDNYLKEIKRVFTTKS